MSRRSKGRRWESAGWGVFFLLFAAASGPLLYFAHGLRAPGTPPMAPYFAALFAAALASGVLTAILNTILQSRSASGGGEETDGDA